MDYEKKFIQIRKVSEITGLDNQTVRSLFGTGIFGGYKTPKGRRMFGIEYVKSFCNISEENKINYIYIYEGSK